MKFITFAMAAAVAFFASGCAGLEREPPAMTTVSVPAGSSAGPVLVRTGVPSSAHTDCEALLQPGCVDLKTITVLWSNNPVMQGLDQHPATLDERRRRAGTLGSAFWNKLRTREVAPAGPRTYYYLMWNVADVPLSHMRAFSVNMDYNEKYQHRVTPTQVELVTQGPYATSAVEGLGVPHRVYRIRSEGANAVGVSFLIPWTFYVPGKSYMVLCMEGGVAEQVYPPSSDGKRPDGLRYAPNSLAWYHQKPSKRVISPFIAR